jgi:hypothetical protein
MIYSTQRRIMSNGMAKRQIRKFGEEMIPMNLFMKIFPNSRKSNRVKHIQIKPLF